MSELINNKEYKQQKLKELIIKLHKGASVEEVQEEFNDLTIGVTATEITQMEQALVDEGMPVEDIQRLCDVHAAVFKGSIEDIHNDAAYDLPEYEEGHPIHTFKRENRAVEDLLDNKILGLIADYSKSNTDKNKRELVDAMSQLYTIDNHYKRKENLIFPFMERYEITAPPKVMWGIDDQIRELIKSIMNHLKSTKNEFDIENFNHLSTQIKEMIFKEEEIMIPMILEKFTQEEWSEIERSSGEIGFTLISAVKHWMPKIESSKPEKTSITDNTSQTVGFVTKDSETKVEFDAGNMTAEEINSILNTIPIDMTFVGADNRVKYFTQGKERIFDRPRTIIGREVKNCHPPKSVHVVEKIVEDLKSGKKDNEDFWIRMGGMFVYIRYFAVRNKQGKFLGTLEISQDIKPITELEGEKRLSTE